MSHELIEYWEKALGKAEEHFESVPEALKDSRYWHDVAPYKNIVRLVRMKSEVPICWGAADCVKTNLVRCEADKHGACEQHRYNCFICEASGSQAYNVAV